MPTKDINKRRKATRERVRKFRERKKAEAERRETPRIVTTPEVTPVDIENLPASLKWQLQAETNARRVLHLPGNLKDRQETMVRRFRGF